MACSSRSLFALALAASWPARVVANGAATFQWSFGENMISTKLTQCGIYDITVSSRDNSSDVGVAPYYLIAFKADGIPTTSYIGTSPGNLSWQVNQASGSNLVLTIADANGNSGGEPGSVYTVSDGDSSCLPSPPSVNVTLVANISTSEAIETCKPLGLRVYGGQKPYNISIAALDSPVVTNVTLGDNDDVLTWINRADPNRRLIVSVSDANGTWGTGTGLFNTTGSADYNCTGLVTTSGSSANVNQRPTQPSTSNSHTTVIVAVVVAVCVVLLICAAILLWRRRRLQQQREPEPAFLPDAWTGPASALANGSSTSPYDPPLSRESKLAHYRDELAGAHASQASGAGRGSSSQAGVPLLTPASQRPSTADGNSSSGWASTERSPSSSKTSPRLQPGVSPEWRIEPDIIIQHRDGGTVQEIPPPYIDHSAATGSSDGAGPSNVAGLSRYAGANDGSGTSNSTIP